MGLTQFWRCDTCLTDVTQSDPQGWLLKGRRLQPLTERVTDFDLYLCSDKCAAQYFTNYADTHKES